MVPLLDALGEALELGNGVEDAAQGQKLCPYKIDLHVSMLVLIITWA